MGPGGPLGVEEYLNRTRGERLLELATLLSAGIETDRALAIVGVGDRRARILEHLVERGLLQPQEQPMLAVMLEIGRLDRGLRLLGEQVRQEHRLVARIKGRLALPLAIWVIAVLIAPLPALFGGDQDLAQYAGAVVQPLVLTLAMLWLGFRHWRLLLDGVRELQLRMGGVPWSGQRLALLSNLKELLAGGLDADRALAALAHGTSGEWRRRLEAAGDRVREGRGLAAALAANGLLHRRHDVPVLAAGETAGRLVHALEHRVSQLHEERNLRMEMIAEWLPRGVYFLVILHLVRGVV